MPGPKYVAPAGTGGLNGSAKIKRGFSSSPLMVIHVLLFRFRVKIALPPLILAVIFLLLGLI